MKGPAGYGRYDDELTHVGCPRARSDMTPCIARDGALALADDGTCVGCSADPWELLQEAHAAAGGQAGRGGLGRRGGASSVADRLKALVRQITEPSVVEPPGYAPAIEMPRPSDEKRCERLLRLLAEEGAARCCYTPGAGDPELWPDSRCDCKYLGPSLHRPDVVRPMGEQTGCCEIRAAYAVVRDHSGGAFSKLPG